MRLAVLLSSGKDSVLAMHRMAEEHEIVCLLTMYSLNEHSYMFHTPAIKMTSLQAEALELPLSTHTTKGVKEEELADLKNFIQEAIEKYSIEGIVTGATYSTYQKERIEKICNNHKIKCFSPLWHVDQEEELRELINNNYEFIFTRIAAEGLNKSWLNVSITEEHIDKLKELNKSLGLHLTGEGGEFESLVLDAPMFKKKIVIEESEIHQVSIIEANLVIKKAKIE